MIFSRNHPQPNRVILNHLPTADIAETLRASAACTDQVSPLFTFPFSYKEQKTKANQKKEKYLYTLDQDPQPLGAISDDLRWS